MKEIVIIMGIQGAGKSTLVNDYITKGYTRFNRDEMGGDLAKLNAKLEQAIKNGKTLFVLDNTYGTKENRKPVVDIAKRNGFKIKCVWLTTKIEDAQFNVTSRIFNRFISHYSDMLSPARMKMAREIYGPNGSKDFKDPSNIPSIALYAYKKSFEEPTIDEGFDSIAKVDFKRNPVDSDCNLKAVILDYDGTLRETKSGDKYPKNPDDVIILPKRKEILAKYKKNGYLLLGVSNQSGIEKGDVTEETVLACFEKTNKLLGFDIPVQFCPHHSFPIRCYCRKPLPALGVYYIKALGLNPAECIMVGNSKSDETFGMRCGFRFIHSDIFFK
jgi:histidinol-phosphate phosphatase family protein